MSFVHFVQALCIFYGDVPAEYHHRMIMLVFGCAKRFLMQNVKFSGYLSRTGDDLFHGLN